MPAGLQGEDRVALESRLLYLAWRWYRITSGEAEDILQAALLAYLQVKDRYEKPEEHTVILVGIFRTKCREHLAKLARASRGLRALKQAARAGEADIPVIPPASSSEAGVLAEMVDDEDGRLILEALAQLRPKAREMFELIIDKGASRQDLIEHYGINKNTLDSRLRAYRTELRDILRSRGVRI